MGWLVVALSILSTVHAQTSIQVSLKPAWNATSILVEASEYFGRQSAEAYWSFVDSIIQANVKLDTEEAEYNLALDIARKISGPSVAEVLKYSLSIRNFSPTAELYRQMFQQAVLRDQKLHASALTVFDHCEGVADVGGKLVCAKADNVASSLGNTTFSFVAESFDHVFPSVGGTSTVALYASLASPSFPAIHHALVAFAASNHLTYIFRPLVVNSDRSLSLSGFGIELAQKNMEYKVLDDKKIVIDEDENVPSIANLLGAEDEETDLGGFFFNRLISRRPDLKSSLSSFRDELLAAQKDEGKIKAWDMKDLGIQSSQSIVRAKDPLVLLRDLSQNFPMYATGLTKLRVNKTIATAFAQRKWGEVLPRGDAALVINGIPMSAEEIDVFQLHNFLQQEAQISDELRLLKLPPSALAQVRAIPRPSGKTGYLPTKDAVRVNTVGKGSHEAVTWLNDIGSDSKYNVWPRSVAELLQPGWPGQLRYVRKNLYTGLVIANPASQEGLKLFERASFFVENNAPIRVGFSFLIPSASDTPWPEELLPLAEWAEFAPEKPKTKERDNSPSALIAKLFRWFVANENVEAGNGFLKALYARSTDFTTTSEIKSVFQSYFASLDLTEGANSVLETVQTSAELEEYVNHCKTFVSNLGVTKEEGPSLFLNGMHSAVPASADFRSVLVESLLSEQRYLTQLVREGAVNDHTDFYYYFVASPSAVPRLSSHVVDASETPLLPYLPKWNLQYFFPADKEFLVKVASYWCVGDFNTLSGLQLASAALSHLSNKELPYNSRVALLHNPASGSGSHLFARFAETALKQLTATKALPLVRKAAELGIQVGGDESRFKSALLKLISVHPKLKETHQSTLRKSIETSQWVSSVQLATIGIVPGERKVIANGRPIAIPEHANQLSLVGDLQVLDQYENVHRKGDAVQALLQDITFTDMNPDDITSAWVDEVALRIAFLVSKRASFASSSVSAVQLPHFDESDVGILRFRTEDALLRVVAVVDPLSKISQRLAPFLLMLRDQMQADVTLVLNPPEFISSFPLKRFYRYAIPSALTFNEKGMVAKKPGLFFRNLVTKSTLTLTIDTPEAWMVAAAYAQYDLDNLRLSDITQDNVIVEFDLRHLLLTGQCLEPSSEPPAGLQLDLQSETGKVVADTLVMANLGYFQLQANPGVWYLSLHEAANTIYKVTKGVLTQGAQHESMKVIISAFDEPMHSLSIERRPGQELAKLSDLTMAQSPTPKKGGGFFSSLFGGNGDEKGVVKGGNNRGETIHVFSVASGHLYERFLKIMMLSVIKSTKSPVKFWFIENFFSPQFKEFVPRMAEKYGYEVEFVTYKWPEWLRRQEEKQRVIWGYKILFLDVLFPLDLKKVIYIDADQVVRGDLKELWTMDLKGAPYAYTPFCNSNPDTEGFRFWKQGYWRDQLRGRPYHISALYVVDLLVFRKLRAGDSLRMVYDNLSQDPNSLANLDQDLPNYAQSMVPIFSLPQEWLWCQAWCSMETLGTAKTIDLCNNPLTKRPKLEVAKELLPEWETLDKEASALTHTFVARNTTHEDL